MRDFLDVLSDYFSKDMRVKGEPMNIKFKEGAEFTPCKVSKCCQVPLHSKEDDDAVLANFKDINKATDNLLQGHFVTMPKGHLVRPVTH